MVYNVSEAQQPVRDMMKEIGPKLEEMGRIQDRKPDGFAHDMFKYIADKGLVGFTMPKELGGGGRTALEYATLIEEVAYYRCAVIAVDGREPTGLRPDYSPCQ